MQKIKNLFIFVNSNEGSLREKVLRGGYWVFLSSILTNVLTLIRSIILARLLVPEIFGLMSICLIAIRALDVITQTGFGAALIQRKENFEDARDTAFTIQIIRGFIIAFILFAISPFVASFYKMEILDPALKVIALSLVGSGFKNINTIALQKELNFKILAYLEQIVNTINFIIIIALAYYFRNIWALVIGYVISTTIDVLLSYIIVSRDIKIRFNKDIAKELFNYGKFITGLSIILFIVTELDNAVIGRVIGVEYLGYYVLAYTVANIFTAHISKIISGVLFPAYSKLQDDLQELKYFYFKGVKYISMIIVPASIGIIILAPEIVRIMYGEKWLEAVVPMQILAVFGAIRAMAAINGYVFNGTGRPYLDFWTSFARLSALAIFIYPFSIKWGITGTAIVVTLSIMVQYILGLLCMNRMIHIRYIDSAKIMMRPIAYSIIMGSMLYMLKVYIKDIHAVQLVFLIGFGVFVYLLMSGKEAIHFVRNLDSIIAR